MNHTLQFIPLAVSIIGAVLVLLLSPGHLTVIDGGTFEQDTNRSRARAKRKNYWLKVGSMLVVIGVVGQLIVVFAYPC